MYHSAASRVGRRRRGRRVGEDHDRRGDDVDQEAVHPQQMRDPAPRVAEFARRQHVVHGGLHGDGHHVSAGELLLCPVLGGPPVVEEVPGAPLVDDVEERAARDQERHQDDVGLHDGGRYGRRKLSEGIAGEHCPTFPRCSRILRTTVTVAATASQSFE